MRDLALLLILAASGAQAQYTPPPSPPLWQPTMRYVTAGQDEPGYRSWYMAAPWRPAAVRSLNAYLATYQVAGVVPTWQLLRTASDWQRCGGPPFEVAPTSEWPNIVQTLRYIRDRVIPTVGPVEPVSAYRNPALNHCAGGANESAHRFMQAVDLVPLRPISREALMRELCAVHRREGEPYGVGLGFYAYHRFHIDTRRFRNWGFGHAPEAEQCRRDPRPPPPPPPLPAAVAPPTDPDPPAAAPDLARPLTS
ncbi:MAG: D-Ala-D-Ala carboxypeptidase family metallohydrolase [Sphingomicrobium sp.]